MSYFCYRHEANSSFIPEALTSWHLLGPFTMARLLGWWRMAHGGAQAWAVVHTGIVGVRSWAMVRGIGWGESALVVSGLRQASLLGWGMGLGGRGCFGGARAWVG